MRVFFRVVLALVLIGAVVGLGAGVYNAGVTRGITAVGQVALPDGANGVGPYAYYGLHRPWGFGFGLFGLIGPLLFFFLIFAIVRGLFFRGGRGPWGHGPWNRGDWDKNVPPMVQEWHRKMHETEPAAK
ncbi:MAG TPA: hypothetical protein VFF59_05000 [Anaerolineae bacterium]|nr:hypothetical protein [Anaerolineae bacterium]